MLIRKYYGQSKYLKIWIWILPICCYLTLGPTSIYIELKNAKRCVTANYWFKALIEQLTNLLRRSGGCGRSCSRSWCCALKITVLLQCQVLNCDSVISVFYMIIIDLPSKHLCVLVITKQNYTLQKNSENNQEINLLMTINIYIC